MRHVAQCDTGKSELPEVGTRTTAHVAAVAVPRRTCITRHLCDCGVCLSLVLVGCIRILDDRDELGASLRVALDNHFALVVLGDL